MDVTLAQVERALAEDRWPTLPGDDGVGRWLARAIGRDRSVMAAHPELVFPCAYRHLRRHGGEDGVPPIRALLDEWRREQRARGGGRWLRALRAAAVPLDAPLLEEVRGASARPGWPASEPPRFSLGGTHAFGRFGWRDRISGASGEVTVDDEASFGSIADAPSGDVLVAGWWGDYDGVVCRVSPESGRLIWRTDFDHWIEAISMSPDGRLALVHDRQRNYAVDVETGRVTRAIDLVPPAPCRFSPDGRQIAVDARGALQVWELSGLLEGRWPETGGAGGLVDAEFSPDGGLLLTGQRLCDGRTGRLIATLDVERGIYLEGGPPLRGRRVVRDGFVEASMHGLRRWDAAGRLVVDDQQRRFAQWHEVAFASDGELYALGRGSGEGPIELRGVRDDRLLAVIEARCGSVFEWSPDDRQLAFATTVGEVGLANLDGSYRILGRAPVAVELRFSIDGALIRARDRDGAVRHFSVARGTQVEGEVFRDRAHPHLGRFAHGLFEIVDERSGEVVARIPSDEPLVSDATGTFWAGRRSHFQLDAC